MDSVKSFLPSSSSAPPSSEEEPEADNIFTYLLSFIGVIFTFTYNNFAYISGIMLVMFGILVYIDMTKIDLSSQPMGRSKTVVIESMVNNNNAGDDDNEGDNPGLKNDLITPLPVELETKLKSEFCKMHASKNSPMTELDSECGAFEKSSCLNTDCCGWAVTSDNPDGKCHAGDKSGITFNYDNDNKKIDIDCYYYKGNTGIGSKCVQ
uniref:Uncharacterized protein n=1 Tax=viral metagenome TaxID=1070528 RepID=A0A6C0F2D1_9ZZZZ